MPQIYSNLRPTLWRAFLSTSLLLSGCAPPQATYPVSTPRASSTSTSQTATPNSPSGQSQAVPSPNSNPGTVSSPPNSPSVASDGVKVQVFFPTEGNVTFGIKANLGNSITIELQDQQGNNESQSISRQDYPQLLTFARIKPGSLNISIFNEQRELLNTGHQEATIPDFNTAIQITATPSQPLATVQTSSLSSLNINTSFRETSQLDNTTPAELVEELDFSSAEWRARIAANYETEALQVGQRVPETGFHSKQVLYQLSKAPFRTYKVFFPSTYWALGAHWDPQKAVNHEELLQPSTDCSWSGFPGTGTCQTLTIESRNRSPFFLRPRGWGAYALKVEDITDKVGPPSKPIQINPQSPLSETIQQGERFYYRFYAKRGELYTVHLATESGDSDLYGGTTEYVMGKKTDNPDEPRYGLLAHTDQHMDNAQKITDANGTRVHLKSNKTCGSSVANACYDSFQWREANGRDYTVMVYGFENSKFRLRVEQGNILGPQPAQIFKTYWESRQTELGAPIKDRAVITFTPKLINLDGSISEQATIDYQEFQKGLVYYSHRLNAVSHTHKNCEPNFEPSISSPEYLSVNGDYCYKKIPVSTDSLGIPLWEILTDAQIRDDFSVGMTHAIQDVFSGYYELPGNLSRAIWSFNIYEFGDQIAESFSFAVSALHKLLFDFGQIQEDFNNIIRINSIAISELAKERGYDPYFVKNKDKRTQAYITGYVLETLTLETAIAVLTIGSVSGANISAKIGKGLSNSVSKTQALKSSLSIPNYPGLTGRIAKSKIASYIDLDRITAGTRVQKGQQIHHLLEKRFLEQGCGWKKFDMDSKVPSILLTNADHQVFTNAWRNKFGYNGSNNYISYSTVTKKMLEKAANEIYADYPEFKQETVSFIKNNFCR